MLALAFRDGTHLAGFHVADLQLTCATTIADAIIEFLQSYERDRKVKVVAAGLPSMLSDFCSALCSRLWHELDVVPFAMPVENWTRTPWHEKRVDEQADSMARRCIL